MNAELVHLKQYKGKKAIIYTVSLDDSETTLFEEFIEEYIDKYAEELKNIDYRIRSMNKELGAREQYFKLKEGALGDGVAAIYDLPSKKLRLYCIRYGSTTIIVGGGGLKTTRTYQEDPKLSKQALIMKRLSKMIYNSMQEKEIVLNSDGTFSGSLKMEE